ncbi:MAG: hypothetical protein WC581_13190 [Thermodesulfovibrionales bacterium]
MKEVEKIPKNKIAQLYDVVHLFRVEVESPKKAPKDMCIEAKKFSGFGKIYPLKKTQCLRRYRRDAKGHIEQGFCEKISFRYQYHLLLS